MNELEVRGTLRAHGIGLRHTKNGWFLLMPPATRQYDPDPVGHWTWEMVTAFVEDMLREVW